VKIPAWQLVLRFALEVAALVAIGVFAGHFGDGTLHYVLAWGVPAVVALAWGTFAVIGDPSRSGNAPVPVPGWIRLALEGTVFLGGAAALTARRSWIALGAYLVALVLHHAMTTERLRWLVHQPGADARR
jgi:hypothetical protein